MYRRFLTAGATAMLATALLLSGCKKNADRYRKTDRDANGNREQRQKVKVPLKRQRDTGEGRHKRNSQKESRK